MRWLVVMAASLVLLAPARAAKQYGEREVAELLEIVQAEKEPETRRAKAVRELEFTPLRNQLPALRKLLREERSPDIRLSAACVLAALGDHKAPKDLLFATGYEGTRTATVSRCDVVLALGRLGDPAAEMHLERALKAETPTDEPLYHETACRSLGMLNSPGARRLLLNALRDGAEDVRFGSVSPLANIAADRKNPDCAVVLEALRHAARTDPAEKVAAQACSALLWNGLDGPGFFRLLEADPEPAVRARAARVMNRHYLTMSRLQRLEIALAREKDPTVRAAIQETMAGQKRIQ